MGNLVKEKILKFKLKNCCYIAPIHYGVLILAYFNWATSIASLLCTVNDNFSTPLKQIQAEILQDQSNSLTSCTLAYAVEESINFMLIIGVHRRDLLLLNLYMFLGLSVAMLTLFVYLVVLSKVGATTSIILLVEILYDAYVLVLVRSEIVNIKEEAKKLQQAIESKEEASGDEEKGEIRVPDDEKEEKQTEQEEPGGWKSKVLKAWSRNK